MGGWFCAGGGGFEFHRIEIQSTLLILNSNTTNRNKRFGGRFRVGGGALSGEVMVWFLLVCRPTRYNSATKRKTH